MSDPSDPSLRSFIDVPPDSPFPIQNLPYGVFLPQPGDPPRIGVAIGEWVLDLSVLEERGLFGGPELRGRRVFRQPTLNPFMSLGPAAWREARNEIRRLLRADVAELRDDAALRNWALVLAEAAEMRLPCEIGDYTDFYACEAHARNVGRIFRGDDAALPPSFRHLPIAYHGRASSVVVSGSEVRRPRGQFRPPQQDAPTFGPTKSLDFELELGWLVGRGNERGRAVPIGRVPNMLFGMVLLNDWSARDIQQWEYVPLGPFAGKNFATTISPWVVPLAALEPFRVAGPAQEPRPLEYLRPRARGSPSDRKSAETGGDTSSEAHAYDIQLEVALQPAGSNTATVVSRTNAHELYWSAPQMVAHHTVGGCNLRTGDLLGSGTISGPEPDSLGSLLELSWNGQRPVSLPGGATRSFLEDGDTVILRGWYQGNGYRVGFGECRGTVLPAAEF